jgi:hypothetical protein
MLGCNVTEADNTVGVMVTVCIADVGPLQPVAVAVMIDVPLQVPTYVTAPVEASMLLPPVMEAASRLYVIAVALVAVAV